MSFLVSKESIIPFKELPEKLLKGITKSDMYGATWLPASLQDSAGYCCQWPVGSGSASITCALPLNSKKGMVLHHIKLTGEPVDGTELGKMYKVVGSCICEECAMTHLGLAVSRSNHGYIGLEAGEVKANCCYGCGQPLCNVCQNCHNDEESCVFIDKKVNTADEIARYSYLKCCTQKARGYGVLANAGLNVPSPYAILFNEKNIETAIKKFSGSKMFVRPCPTRPRHGFVDSRPMDFTEAGATEKLKALLVEANRADEKGTAELLIVPLIDSAYNLILTPGRVAIGEGHDGATAGRGSISMPLMGVQFPDLTEAVIKDSGVRDTEDPYVEVVVSKGSLAQIYFTQLRAGVKIPAAVGADYIPTKVRVEQVIEASGDLLEWETQQAQIKPGTIVVHVGGTLISHYGVHCLTNSVPIMTSRVPVLGEVLEPTAHVSKPSPEAVIRGMMDMIQVPFAIEDSEFMGSDEKLNVRLALRFMMSVLHNAGAMGGESGYWLGAATAVMLRCGMAASHGEARHKLSGMEGKRLSVYKLAMADYLGARDTIGKAQWLFSSLKWSGAYGGPKWAACTKAIIELDQVARALLNERTPENVALMITALNTAVNQAHNGGWWMNKFISQNAFEQASKQYMNAVVFSAIASFKLRQFAKALDVTTSLGIQKRWAESKDVVVEEGSLQIQDVEKAAKPNYDAKGEQGSSGKASTKKTLKVPEKCSDPSCKECHSTMIYIEGYYLDDYPDNITKATMELVNPLGECMHSFKSLNPELKQGNELTENYTGYICSNCGTTQKTETFEKVGVACLVCEAAGNVGEYIYHVANQGLFCCCVKNHVKDESGYKVWLAEQALKVDSGEADGADVKAAAAESSDTEVEMASKIELAKQVKELAKAKLAKQNMNAAPSKTNTNGVVIPITAPLTLVQGHWRKAGSTEAHVHLQYRVAGKSGYKSLDVKTTPKIPGTIPKSEGLASWASNSSEHSYREYKFAAVPDSEGMYYCWNEDLKIAFVLKPSAEYAASNTWEALSGKIEEAKSAAAAAILTATSSAETGAEAGEVE